jgi:hypothetical protein
MIWLNEWYMVTGGMDNDVTIWNHQMTFICSSTMTTSVTCLHSLESSIKSPSPTTNDLRFAIGTITGDVLIGCYHVHESRLSIVSRLPSLSDTVGKDKNYITNIKSVLLPHPNVRTSISRASRYTTDNDTKAMITPTHRVYFVDDAHFRSKILLELSMIFLAVP